MSQISYKNFLTKTNDGTWAEWVNGEVITMTDYCDQQNLRMFLVILLGCFAEEKQRGKIFFATFQMKVGRNLPGRSPDIFFVAKKRLGRLQRLYYDGPADLVIEIISPESRSRDRGDKFYEYEQGGVKEYWLVDPQRQQAEFYQRSRKGIYQAVQPDAQGRYYSSVLKELWLKVDWLWQTPLPPLMKILKEWKLV